MKKILLASVLLIGLIFVTTAKLGAEMNKNYTQVRVEHILLKTEDEARALKQKIVSNEISFEDAAKEYSNCPSKANGGDLGYFGHGVMVKEFEEASFNTTEGNITGPVKTQFGWHLIKVIDKK